MRQFVAGELAGLYLRWADDAAPRSRRHRRGEIERWLRGCWRELGGAACGEIEEAAREAYLVAWRELMQRNHDGLLRTAAWQLTRIAPDVPRVEGDA